MIALARMRLAGFLRGGRILAPLILVPVLLGVLYGGSSSPAAGAYGYSAAVLFPVLAWQTKLLLDTEPDVQRRLARTAVGARAEAAAGLLAAAGLALAVVLLAMIAPWPFGGIDLVADPVLGTLFGLFAHLLVIPPAVTIGALAARPATGSVRTGIAVLVVAAVLVVVLGLRGSVVPWLVPPVMAVARDLSAADPPGVSTRALRTGWMLLWCAAALAGYARLRRSRA